MSLDHVVKLCCGGLFFWFLDARNALLHAFYDRLKPRAKVHQFSFAQRPFLPEQFDLCVLLQNQRAEISHASAKLIELAAKCVKIVFTFFRSEPCHFGLQFAYKVDDHNPNWLSTGLLVTLNARARGGTLSAEVAVRHLCGEWRRCLAPRGVGPWPQIDLSDGSGAVRRA